MIKFCAKICGIIPLPSIKLPRHWPPLCPFETSKQAPSFVVFQVFSLERALQVDSLSNTWRACIRHPLSDSTDFPLAYPLAIGRTPLPLTVWHCPVSFSCPVPSVLARRPPPPVCERHAWQCLTAPFR
jgi:hypothetical protein